ncbi:hypothetical protein FRC12_000072 [Ceratobasidium sp. 428]|nr:hypothetical protein FRC12_000072 [Ceratobasidium sp. 428]
MSFSGSFVTSANKLSGSSYNDRIQGPHMLNFHRGDHFMKDWSESGALYYLKASLPSGSTQNWCEVQPATRFTRVQHRKERAGPFFHEFIVVELDNDTVCRFDRRGDPTTRANAFTTKGITAEDTAHVIQKHEAHYAAIDETSDLLLQIDLPDGQDLRSILIACCCMNEFEATRSYSLLTHNCYFFSWAILAAVLDIRGEHYRQMFRHKLSNSILIKMKNKIFGLGNPWLPLGQTPRIDAPGSVIDDASRVYLHIVSRIRDHCRHLRTFGVFLSPEKLEDTIYACLALPPGHPTYARSRI